MNLRIILLLKTEKLSGFLRRGSCCSMLLFHSIMVDEKKIFEKVVFCV